MTNEEVIYELETNIDYKSEKIKEACQMAIRSLEAWKKCRQEIISFIDTLKAEHYDYNVALDILEIFNQHMQEVENGKD